MDKDFKSVAYFANGVRLFMHDHDATGFSITHYCDTYKTHLVRFIRCVDVPLFNIKYIKTWRKALCEHPTSYPVVSTILCAAYSWDIKAERMMPVNNPYENEVTQLRVWKADNPNCNFIPFNSFGFVKLPVKKVEWPAINYDRYETLFDLLDKWAVQQEEMDSE